MKRAPLCLALALMLVLCLLPAAVLAADDDHDGFDDGEMAKLREFLDQESSVAGNTNGLQLTPGYNASVPATWASFFTWSGGHVTQISLSSLGLAGSLDVSGFTSLTAIDINSNALASLNVSDCTALETLECDSNALNALPLDNCANIKRLVCSNNSLKALDASGKASLEELYCDANQIKALNIAGDTALQKLYCGNNLLTSIDTTVSTNLMALEAMGNPVTSIKTTIYEGKSYVEFKAYGGGYLIFTLFGATQFATSMPCIGKTLINYTESGTDIGIVPFIMFSPGTNYDMIANFTPLTVTCVSNGGSAVPVLDATYNEQIASPVCTLTNYELEGWYEDITCLQRAVFPYAVTQDITLYAKWKAAPRLSSSDADGKVTPGESVTLTPNLEGGTWSFDEAVLSRSGSTFTALKSGSVRVTYAAEGQSAYDDLVVDPVLALSSSDADGKVTPGESVTLTPNIEGGAWRFDETVLSRSGSTFTALKPGSTRITYAAEGQSAYYDLVVSPVLTLSSSDADGEIIMGETVTLTPNLEGGTWRFDEAVLSRSGSTFTALKPGSVRVTYTAEGQSAYYDLIIIPALTLISSAPDAKIYVNGRIILTPNIEGGTWNWDSQYFSATSGGSITFTPLKAGTSVITYTVDGQTVSCTVTIEASELPATGQNFTSVFVMLAVAAMIAGIAWAIGRKALRRCI